MLQEIVIFQYSLENMNISRILAKNILTLNNEHKFMWK